MAGISGNSKRRAEFEAQLARVIQIAVNKALKKQKEIYIRWILGVGFLACAIGIAIGALFVRF